jgi:hypothetical protein
VAPTRADTALTTLGVVWALAACSSADGGANQPAFAKDSGFDYAVEFDGVDDYASTGSARFPVAYAPQTISLWANPAGGAAKQGLVTLRRDFESGVELGFQGTTPSAWRVYGAASPITGTAALAPGTWHHLAYVYDGTLHRVFADGVVVATSTLAANERTPTLGWIGTLDGVADLFHGKLDEVRVWNAALDPATIAAEANGTEPFDDGTLVAYWSFDESGGARAYDRSPSGNDAELGDGIDTREPKRVLSDAPHARITR